MPIVKLKFKVARVVTNHEDGGPIQRVYKLDLVATGENLDQRDGLITWSPALEKDKPSDEGCHGELNFAEIHKADAAPQFNVAVGDEIVVDIS